MTATVRTRRWLLALIALVAVAVSACGDKEPARQDLLDALDKTRDTTYRFVYRDERPDGVTEVRGSIEDDFRVAARVAADGKFVYDQIVNDDSLAVRFYSPESISGFVDKSAGSADTSTEIDGVDALAVLASRRWVLDPEGAPLFTSQAGAETEFGIDPVRDAMTVLDYVEQAIREAVAVEVYNPDDLSPVFSSSEDVFPKPPQGGPVKRYDLRRPDLPAVAVDTQGEGDNILATRHFRKMVVYVQDGVVVRVLERVEIIGKQVNEVVGLQRRVFDEVDLPQEVVDGFEEMVASIPEDQIGAQLLEFINFGLEAFGFQPVLNRTMSVDLLDHGDYTPVALPDLEDETVVKGSLEALVISGYARDTDGATSGGPEAGAGDGGGGDGAAGGDDGSGAGGGDDGGGSGAGGDSGG